jgi:beta-phosphoglucomutase-like phosphatase (HAD superfamily)
MHIALFDIDGTLTASSEIDSLCFSEAFRDVFGIDIDTDWNAYEHTTDRGIASEALRRAWGHEPAEADLARHRERLVELLNDRMTRLEEVPGARAFLANLITRGWRLALCTGAWSDSARLKLSRAGLPSDLPLASCDDDSSREAILRRGMALAGGGEQDRVISFGDSPWDVRAAGNLRLPFVGIATGERVQELRRGGAADVFEDFRDADAVFAAIDRVTAEA